MSWRRIYGYVSTKATGSTCAWPVRCRPDPEFIKETLAQFPDKGMATVEEARVGKARMAHCCSVALDLSS